MRKSNFELLRIICMLFIVLHHFIVHGLESAGYFTNTVTSMYGVFFNSLFVVAVNCFITHCLLLLLSLFVCCLIN
jgi:peptidoglycan/LPS O-acetylase OafA/YrhL